MKSIHKLLFFSLLSLPLWSCEKYLDINKDPNSATEVQAELILPGAIVTTANYQVSYNNYGASLVGYVANAGGFSGFGNFLTYNFVPGTYSQWGTFDNLLDYKYVSDAGDENKNLAHFKAAAEILSVYQFQKIVDQHGDIPYEEALQGKANYAPKYTDAAKIYQDLVPRLSKAIALFTDNPTASIRLAADSDPLFKGNIDSWKRLANTIKLRLLIRLSNVAGLQEFVKSEYDKIDLTIGFLTNDAIVNPGYVKDRPNPTWSALGYNTSGNAVNTSRVPTFYIYGFYDGNKLNDSWRGSVIFNDFGNIARPTPLNQLGNESGNPPVRSGYPTWYTGNRASASSISDALGIVKGPTQGQPIFLAAESYFLQSEAILRGFLSGDVQTAFENGIKASFRYLYKDVNGTVPATKNVDADFASYKAANASSPLVNFALAGSFEQRLEAIITQKYIAFNQIVGEEAWNDYRRTNYPKTIAGAGRYADFASLTSQSPRPDKLPTIIKYPASEYSFNAENTKDVDHFKDLIFWAK